MTILEKIISVFWVDVDKNVKSKQFPSEGYEKNKAEFSKVIPEIWDTAILHDRVEFGLDCHKNNGVDDDCKKRGYKDIVIISSQKD